MERNSFIFNTNRCVGCNACAAGCSIENGTDLMMNWREVNTHNKIKHPGLPVFHFSLACNHCEDAPCEQICPVSALHYLDNGIVNVDKSRCIGCAGCMMACPYGAIYMDPETNTADKCTYCAHRIEGGLMPACVVACPVEANIFGDIEDPLSNISQYISRDKRVQVRKPEKNTKPKHFYVGGGQAQLNPLAATREEGYSLFTNITHLKHIGKAH